MDNTELEYAIELSGLQFGYSGKRMFDGLSLRVGRGERVAVRGESGIGKSTLLRIVSGELPANGQVKALPCGMVFQHDGVFPWLTCMQNILLVMNHVDADRVEKVRSELKQVGLIDSQSQLASELSGGQRQRLQIARLCALGSPLWLMDEPFNELDRDSVAECQKVVLNSAARHEATIVLVTHNVEDLNQIATRAVHLTRTSDDKVEITCEEKLRS